MIDERCPFEIGDIIRLKFTSQHYLITGVKESERTGHPLAYHTIDLLANDREDIYYYNFDQYVIKV